MTVPVGAASRSTPARRTPTSRAVLGAVVSLSLVAGCGGLRTPAGVTVVRKVQTDTSLDEPDVRRVAPGPIPGATPEQIVSGFLAAEANDEGDDHLVAREFLTPSAVWDPSVGVTVYDPTDIATTVSANGTVVDVVREQQAEISRDFAYTPRVGRLHDRYRLAMVGGQWRLASVPKGLRLTASDVSRNYRAVTLWFLTPNRSVLVPDPVLLPSSRTALPSVLMRALLRGPTRRLAPAVRTAVPAGTALLGSAAVVEGVASADLSSQAALTRGQGQKELLAQVAATMAQLPSVSRVHVTVEGRPLTGGAPDLIPSDAVGGMLPDALLGTRQAFSVLGGGIVPVRAQPVGANPARPTGTQPISGPALARLVVSAGGSRVAAVRAAAGGLGEVVVGDLQAALAGRLSRLLGPDRYSSLSFGPDGELWVVRHTQVVVVGAGATREVSVRGLSPTARVTSAVLARDGVRVALVVSDRGVTSVQVGYILRDGQRRTVAGLVPLVPTLDRFAAVAWEDATTLAVVAAVKPSGTLRAWEIAADGSTLTADSVAGLPGTPSWITAAPGLPLLVESQGRIWALSAGWVTQGPGRFPAYAG